MGIAGLCGTTLVALKMLWNLNISVIGGSPKDKYEALHGGFSVLIGCFLLGWLIYGFVMVFSMECQSQDHSQPNYCQYSAYAFAYGSIIFRKSTLAKSLHT